VTLRFAPLLIGAAAAAALYVPVLSRLVAQWLEDRNNSHGPLLVVAAALVLRRRWAVLRTLPADGRDAGLAMLVVALGVYTVGTLGADVFLPRLSLPFAVAGCVLALGGRRHLRLAAAPLLLLLIAIPLPAVLMTWLTMPLQLMSSQIAAATLQAAQMDVMRQGNLLTLPHITLEVVEACSGLQSAVSLVSVAAVTAAGLSLSGPRALLLLIAAVPIAVVGNGLRVAASGVLSQWFGEAALKGGLHDATGYVAFLVMCGVLLAVHVAARRIPRMAALQARVA
jgi:exosortase